MGPLNNEPEGLMSTDWLRLAEGSFNPAWGKGAFVSVTSPIGRQEYMKAKNHRKLPADSLWKPHIHDGKQKIIARRASEIAGETAEEMDSLRNRLSKKSAANLAGRYMSNFRKREYDKQRWTRSEIITHCCRELKCEKPEDAWERLHVFQRYFVMRGYKLSKSQSTRRRKNTNSFYKSQEWLRLRYMAIKLNGRKCQACGDANSVLHVDHIKPKSKYPELALELSNLQVLCHDCNIGKGAWDETDWRPEETKQ